MKNSGITRDSLKIKSFEVLILEVRELKNSAIETMYDVVLYLQEIESRPEFREKLGNYDMLDQYLDFVFVADTVSPYRHAVKIMEHFPEKEEWVRLGWRKMNIQLDKMKAEAAKKRRALEKGENPSVSEAARRLAEHKARLAAEKKVKDAERKASAAKEDAARARRKLTDFEMEVDRQKKEKMSVSEQLREAKATIRELRKQLEEVTAERDDLKKLFSDAWLAVV